MAKIISTEELTSNIVKNYLEVSVTDYSTFLKSAPIFVNYYSKNLFHTTFDNTFENINEVVGADSPVIFDRINDLPIYSTENASFVTEITDFGITGDVTSTCIISPGTVKPEVDDYFFLKYDNIVKLFRVSDVEIDKYNNVNFYKVNFYLTPDSVANIELQVNKKYRMDFNNVGKINSPYVEEDKFVIVKDLKTIFNSLLDNFNNNYYDDRVMAYVNKTQVSLITTRSIIDSPVNFFIKTNKLSYSYDGYRDYLNINSDYIGLFKVSDFNKSFLGLLSKTVTTIKSSIVNDTLKIIPANDSIYGNNWRHKTKYNYIEYTSSLLPINDLFERFTPFDITLINGVDSNSLTSITNIYYKFIIKALNGTYNSNLSVAIDDLNDIIDYDDNYYIIPVCLYLIKKIIDDISNHRL